MYFIYLAVNCYLSFLFGFEAVVLNLIFGHLAVWICSVVFVLLLFRYQKLPKGGVVSALFEALFVPAYLVDLNKKILRLRYSEISALRLHLRSLKRASFSDTDLIRHELLNQTNAALDDEADPAKNQVIREFMKCLKT